MDQWRIVAVLFICVVFTAVDHIQGQGICPPNPGVWTGIDTTLASNNNPGPPLPTEDDTFILKEKGLTNCFGTIAEWRAVINGGCGPATGNVHFEVWRDLGVGDYKLVGYNTIDNCIDLGGGEISVRVPQNARIPIEDNNIIGWSWLTGDGVSTTTAAGTLGNVDQEECEPTIPGGNCVMNNNVEDYLLQARLELGPPPTIDNLPTTVELPENEPIVTFVYNVLASHPSSRSREVTEGVIVDPATAVLFTFAACDPLLPFTCIPGAALIGEMRITTSTILDYEATTQYILPVSVVAMQQTASATLTINVRNRNEAHTLDNLDASTSVSVQNTACQTVPIYTVTYVDVDDSVANTFPVKRFYILSSNPLPPEGVALPFTIDANSGEVFCTADLETWTTAMGQIYSVDISVTDGMHQIPGVLTINIQQTHDPPVLTNLDANQDIREDLAAGSQIFHVFAAGPIPADLRFSIIDVAPRNDYYFFEIDAITGVITLTSTANLDVLMTPYTVTVSVEDNLQMVVTPGVLTIDILWVNEKPLYNPDEYFISIPEECGGAPECNATTPFNPRWLVPGLVLMITDRDVDNGIPVPVDVLACEILPSFGSDRFHHANAPYDCYTMYQEASIDIDLSPEYKQINLTIRVRDTESVSNNDKGDVAHIYITVYDINDNSPIFTAAPYTATIPENTPGGVSLFTVTATDIDDSAIFSEVTYSLLDSDVFDTPPPLIDTDATLHFEIDPISGLVRTKQYVDYEAINPKSITFTIRATDGGGNIGNTSATITITDVNDVPPVWDCTGRRYEAEYIVGAPCFYDDELRSDILLYYHVMDIRATDVDTPVNLLTYHLLQPIDYFNLGPVNGSIHVSNYLEAYVKYILYCYSQDNGSPSLQTRPHLRVRIDTFDPHEQLIDIVMEIPETDIDEAVEQDAFMALLRSEMLTPWFPKMETYKVDKDKVTMTIYALRDNSTFNENNLHKKKEFVHRNELLDKLRKDLHGTPKEELTLAPFDPYNVILVEPTYPIWLIDTIPGIITLFFICLALLVLLLALILGLCNKYNKCCFKKKKNMKRNWPDKQDKTKKKKYDDYDKLSNHSAEDRRPAPRERRDSIDTIHSLIYNPN